MSNSFVLETAVLVSPFVRVLSIQNESNTKKGLSRKLLEPLPCAETSQDTRETPTRESILNSVKSSCLPHKNSLVLETSSLAPSFVRVHKHQGTDVIKGKCLPWKLLEPLPCADTNQDTRETLRVSSIPYSVKLASIGYFLP